ncbi:MAG: hypothetical protein JNK85_05620 [Verrucomicrobiales bacterium]|nr:hypothetical protein [Verrucomicrobiales bacterium]
MLLPIPGWATEISDTAIVGSRIHFSFDSETNVSYAIEQSTELVTNWVSILEYAGRGSPIRVEIPLSAVATFFRIRQGPRPPWSLDLRPVILKAGESVALPLRASGDHGTLQWTGSEGALPEGIRLLPEGRLEGVPSAAAAEFNEDGRYAVPVKVTEANSDAGPGREVVGELQILVRLSFQSNIRAKREHGPSLKEGCAVCHGSGFPPDVEAPPLSGLVNVASGSGGACGSQLVYVRPGDVAGSLLHEKLSGSPSCGARMPQGGPYLTDRQLERLARWIRELTPADSD